MYEVFIDRGAAMVRVTLRGFWSTDTARSFLAELDAAAAQQLGQHDSFDLLVDMREAFPFSQDVAQILEAAIARHQDHGLHRSAHIAAPAVSELQIKRLSHRNHSSGFFKDTKAAMQWLSES